MPSTTVVVLFALNSELTKSIYIMEAAGTEYRQNPTEHPHTLGDRSCQAVVVWNTRCPTVEITRLAILSITRVGVGHVDGRDICSTD